MCKHVAAVLYGVGARLDRQPELLFRLRAVDETDLVGHVDAALPMSKQGPGAGRVLETDDVSALFGLDMAAPEVPATGQPSAKPGTGRTRRTAPAPKGAASAAKATPPRRVVTAKALPRPVVPERLSRPLRSGASARKLLTQVSGPVRTVGRKRVSPLSLQTHRMCLRGALAGRRVHRTRR
jgi:hypothetical protein